MTEQDKVTVDDIIGIVKTEEQTNSVEEVRKLRGRENKTTKRFRISQGYTDRFCHDWQNNQLLNFRETVELLNELHEENEQCKMMIATLRNIILENGIDVE